MIKINKCRCKWCLAYHTLENLGKLCLRFIQNHKFQNAEMAKIIILFNVSQYIKGLF